MAERKRPKTLMDLAELPGPADWGQEDPRPPRRRSASRKKSGGRSVKGKFPPKKKSLLRRAVGSLFWLGLGSAVIGVVALVGGYAYFSQGLPPVDGLVRDYNPPTVTYVYSDDGRVIGEYFHERRFVIPITAIPQRVVNAFLAVEDADFYQHRGVNPKAILRAFIANWKAGETVQGGSTITQQVAKTFLLTNERSYARKFREMILSLRMESVFSKEDILFLYLNQIYLGQQSYGVEAAARTYFDKTAADLSVAEAAMLAGLVQAPGVNNPVRNPKRARERQQFAIRRMRDVGLLSEAEAQAAAAEELSIRATRPNPNILVTPYFTEHVRRLMEERVGEDSLYNDGWKIYTTVNIEAQQAADHAVAQGLREYARRRGYRGPEQTLTEEQIEPFLAEQASEFADTPLKPDRLYRAVVMELDTAKTALNLRLGPHPGRVEKKNLSWALKGAFKQRFSRGDVVWVRLADESAPKPEAGAETGVTGQLALDLVLERQTDVQSALLSMDLANGDVKAMVGGRDFGESQFNRAVQSQRQPGSSFKPLLYASAMDHGYTPGSVMLDAPVVIDDVGSRRRWKPVNSDMKFRGPMTLYTALVGSRNLISIKLLDRIGFDALQETVSRLGVTEVLPRSLTIALGAHGLHMPELLSAYSAFANMGQRVVPRYITRIEDRRGQAESFEPERIPSLDPGTACAVTWMLRGVVEHGTGTVIKPLGRPVGAKTGTTNDYSDAWVVGFTPELATAIWVGTDQQRPRAVGEVGGLVAGPIFLYYMRDALKDKPVTDFVVPPEAEIAPGGTFGVCYKAGTIGTGLSETAGSGNAEEEFLRDDFEGDLPDSFFDQGEGLAEEGLDLDLGEIFTPATTVTPISTPPAETRPRAETPRPTPPRTDPPRVETPRAEPPRVAPPENDRPTLRSVGGSMRDNPSGGVTRLRTYGEEAVERERQAAEEAARAAAQAAAEAAAVPVPADATEAAPASQNSEPAADLDSLINERIRALQAAEQTPVLDEEAFDSDEYLRGNQ